MTHKEFLLEEIRATYKIKFPIEIELDNLDKVSIEKSAFGHVSVFNEHGSVYGIEELTDKELQNVSLLLGNPLKYDYVIVNSNNEWLSFGRKETMEQMQIEFQKMKDETNEGENIELSLIYTNHFIIEDYVKP